MKIPTEEEFEAAYKHSYGISEWNYVTFRFLTDVYGSRENALVAVEQDLVPLRWRAEARLCCDPQELSIRRLERLWDRIEKVLERFEGAR